MQLHVAQGKNVDTVRFMEPPTFDDVGMFS